VTSIALDARLNLISSRGGVTSKTPGPFHFLQGSAGSGRQIAGRQWNALMPNRDIQALDGGIETNPRLIEDASVSVYERLARSA
jgi:hypothetical protein